MLSLLKGHAGNPAREFTLWVVVLTLACLWPVWGFRLLPMQDYPQHLFIAHLLATADRPDFNWAQYYSVDPGWGPYALAYAFVRGLSVVAGIEAAGKLVTTLYVVLMALVVMRGAREFSGSHVPWGLLLVFALVFNQTYFLGFQNYLLSIPLLFLALLDLREYSERPENISAGLRLLVWLILLFFAHPYTVLVLLVFGTCAALFYWRERTVVTRMAAILLVYALTWVVWYFASTSGAAPVSYHWEIRWWPWQATTGFFAMMFTGMRWFEGIDPYSLALWLAAGAMLGFFAQRHAHASRDSNLILVLLLLAAVGYAALPFWVGYYSYFNARLAPLIAILAVFLAAHVPLPRGAGHVAGGAALALVLMSVNAQGRVVAETESIMPLLQQMRKNAPVLPVLLSRNTEELDPQVFYQFHAHDHYYYHILVGGGANPLQFPSPMLPVHLRTDVELPALESTPPSAWPWAISHYRYVLVRGSEPSVFKVLGRLTELRGRSGPWTLYENAEWLAAHGSDIFQGARLPTTRPSELH